MSQYRICAVVGCETKDEQLAMETILEMLQGFKSSKVLTQIEVKKSRRKN